MRKQRPVGHLICSLQSKEVEGFEPLAKLALDIPWSWNHVTDKYGVSLIPYFGEIYNPGLDWGHPNAER